MVLCGIVIVSLTFCQGCWPECLSTDDLSGKLSAYDWQSYVGNKTGIWVSIERQELMLVSNYRVLKRYRCSTAKAGAGSLQDSGKTPLGWHRVGAKVGGELTAGSVLKERLWTGQVWHTSQSTDEDLILSRILRLEGLEEGINRGGDVDTWNRYIYIHGTNHVDDLGQPASAGCVRLDPKEVVELYERVNEGCCVLITKE